MVITRYITLDVSRQGVQASIPITQHDAGTLRLLIQLRNGTTPIDLDEDTTAVLYIDTDTYDPVTVYKKNSAYPNYLEYNVSPRASIESGEHKAVLQIFRNGQIYSAPEMILLVKEDYTNSSGVLSSAQYAAVVTAQEAAEEAARVAEEAKNYLVNVKPVATVVQNTGYSANDVMSQKSVTDNLNFSGETLFQTWYPKYVQPWDDGKISDDCYYPNGKGLSNGETTRSEKLDITGKVVKISVAEGYIYNCSLCEDRGDRGLIIRSYSEWQTAHTEPTEWTADGEYKNLIIRLMRQDRGPIELSESSNIKIEAENTATNEVKEKILRLEKIGIGAMPLVAEDSTDVLDLSGLNLDGHLVAINLSLYGVEEWVIGIVANGLILPLYSPETYGMYLKIIGGHMFVSEEYYGDEPYGNAIDYKIYDTGFVIEGG